MVDLNPISWVHRVRTFVSYDADEGDGREIFDSHTWEDPDRDGVTTRIKPATPAGWFLIVGATVLLLGVLFWAAKFFPSAYRNATTLGYAFLIAGWPAMYLLGRKTAVDRFKDFDWSILFYGDSLDVRAGKDKGTSNSDNGTYDIFTPMKGLDMFGYRPSYLQLRDIYPPNEVPKLRSKLHRTDKDGSGEVNDRLRGSMTAEVDTETIGTVKVTHTSELKKDQNGVETDRYTASPTYIDDEIARKLTKELEQKTEVQIPQLLERIELLRNRIQDKESVEAELVAPMLSQARDIVTFVQQVQNPDSEGDDNAIESDHGDFDDRLKGDES